MKSKQLEKNVFEVFKYLLPDGDDVNRLWEYMQRAFNAIFSVYCTDIHALRSDIINSMDERDSSVFFDSDMYGSKIRSKFLLHTSLRTYGISRQWPFHGQTIDNQQGMALLINYAFLLQVDPDGEDEDFQKHVVAQCREAILSKAK